MLINRLIHFSTIHRRRRRTLNKLRQAKQSTNQLNKQSPNPSTDQSVKPSTHQLINSSTHQSINSSTNQSINSSMVETNFMEGEPGLSPELETSDRSINQLYVKNEYLPSIERLSVTNQSIDQLTNESINQSSVHEYVFEPVLFSDVTIHYQSTSYHVHATVLYTASKFFNVLLGAEFSPTNRSINQPENQSINDCEVTARCTRQHHRCIHFEGSSLGGSAITSEEFYEFLLHLYAHVDGTGQWGKQLTNQSIDPSTDQPVNLSDKLPKYYYIARITSVDPVRDIVTYQCYGYDRTSEEKVRGGSILVSGSSVKATTQSVGSWIFSLAVLDSPDYHLAYYFQCDSLMHQYYLQAEQVLNHAASTCLYFPIWKLLRLADRYHWHTMRKTCLELCLKDKHCASRAGWHSLYKTLEPSTSAELLSLALKRT